MGNACNCVSKEGGDKEMNLANNGKAAKAVKKGEQDHDESNVQEDEGNEKIDLDDPEVQNAALKIQVRFHRLTLEKVQEQAGCQRSCCR